MIVAIDGPAGAGKSTVARLLAAELEFCYLDTGAMYRALAWITQVANISPDEGALLASLARTLQVHRGDQGVTQIFSEGRALGEEIRTRAVNRLVSEVAAHPEVREVMVAQQRALLSGGSFVVDGRDIGTVVCPQAQLKVYLTASVAERARRRALEMEEAGLHYELEEVQADIRARDSFDTQRAVAPLRQAADAVLVDSTHLTQAQVVEKLLALVRERMQRL